MNQHKPKVSKSKILISRKNNIYHNILSYFRTELDYGNLMCWATNSVGTQRDPCIFHLIPAGKPDPVHNCSVQVNFFMVAKTNKPDLLNIVRTMYPSF